ncbi:putative hydrolase or acyltransferase of alpha/beta superfamily [Corynebacterium mustelae]|uniref:Putative hydrolase or acyltransferase of alpha/beta superfamily n=1 Tax=Corynebacterium mustelae TaxID=571915 RepID=A0A0G3H167_9CORY|nr:alpha/beta fold hydrolase [Corynebacterium mustelae]AKK05593.1 putative hydrolase or acyltransferase of alpha/beta superfamily [Corynebacterium mustelae]
MHSFSKMLASIVTVATTIGLCTSIPAHANTPAITWEKCPKTVTRPGAACGRIEVPRDYSDPNGVKISIGFIQHTAKAARDTVFLNPGGPGGGVYDLVGNADLVNFPTEFLENFTIVGVQPRGMLGSTPLTCDDDAEVDFFQIFSNAGGQLRAACERTQPGYFPHITTENTARDWEEVRKALKRETISIYGASYGTLLASTYATLFPHHTNKVVLDSGLDHTKKWTDSSKKQESGFIRALHEFFGWAAINDDKFHLGATPYAVYTTWAEAIERQSGVWPSVVPPRATEADLPPQAKNLGQPAVDAMNNTAVARAEAKNLSATVVSAGSKRKEPALLIQTHALLPAPAKWRDIVEFIQNPDLAQHELTELKERLTHDEESQTASKAAIIVNQNILCNEALQPWDRSLFLRAAWTNLVLEDPFSGPPLASAWGFTCNGAPPITQGIALDGSKLATRPLQIQGTSDPQTAFENSLEMRENMNTQFVTVHGPGHGHFSSGNTAVDRLILDYLYNGTVSVSDAPGFFEQ